MHAKGGAAIRSAAAVERSLKEVVRTDADARSLLRALLMHPELTAEMRAKLRALPRGSALARLKQAPSWARASIEADERKARRAAIDTAQAYWAAADSHRNALALIAENARRMAAAAADEQTRDRYLQEGHDALAILDDIETRLASALDGLKPMRDWLQAADRGRWWAACEVLADEPSLTREQTGRIANFLRVDATEFERAVSLANEQSGDGRRRRLRENVGALRSPSLLAITMRRAAPTALAAFFISEVRAWMSGAFDRADVDVQAAGMLGISVRHLANDSER